MLHCLFVKRVFAIVFILLSHGAMCAWDLSCRSMRLLILLVKGGHCVGDCLTVWKMGTSRWTSTCILASVGQEVGERSLGVF